MTPYYKNISDQIEPYSRVLDLGCGKGELLTHLQETKSVQGYGVDIDFENITTCVRKGLSIFQGNINDIIKGFQDDSFDYVSLSHTLQEIYDPIALINEMLRVGKKGIVTFPNFGHWRIRLNLLTTGHSPKSKHLPYEWYDTPNIRVISIKDFKHLCAEKNIKIVKDLSKPTMFSNLFAQKGIFVIQKS